MAAVETKLSQHSTSLGGKSLWSPSYFAGACGGAPLTVIKQYIEQQASPKLKGRGLYPRPEELGFTPSGINLRTSYNHSDCSFDKKLLYLK